MRVLLFLLSRERRRTLAASAIGLSSGLASAAALACASWYLSADHGKQGWVIAGFVTFSLLCLITRLISQFLLVDLAQESMFVLRRELARRVLATGLPTLEQLGPGRLLSVLLDDVAALVEAAQSFPFTLVNAATAVGCLIVLGWISPPALWAALAFLLLGGASYVRVDQWARRRFFQARQTQDELVTRLRDLAEGVKELALNRRLRDVFLERRLDQAAHRYRQQSSAAFKGFAAAGAWAQALFFVLLGTLVFAGNGLDAAPRASAVLVVLYLLRPVDYVIGMMPILSRAGAALASMDRLRSELNGPVPVDITRSDLSPPTFNTLTLNDVTYVHRAPLGDAPFALGPIHLSLARGTIVFITGGNGSGKSTLGKVLVGLYPPATGAIQLDGRPVTTTSENYRSLFSAVFADFHHFADWAPSEKNVAYEPAELIRQCGLEGKTTFNGDRFEDNGLSQGQRRRLALVLALLDDRPVFYFDEWAAEQDPGFRRAFYVEILPALSARGKLVVVNTHDDRYFHQADVIVRLDEGKIVEILPRSPAVR